jgi:hypothetical protein
MKVNVATTLQRYHAHIERMMGEGGTQPLGKDGQAGQRDYDGWLGDRCVRRVFNMTTITAFLL